MKKIKERKPDGQGGFEVIYEDCEYVNILGTEYSIIVRKYDEDKTFKRYDANGYCSCSDHEIVLCDMAQRKRRMGQKRGNGGLDRPPRSENL